MKTETTSKAFGDVSVSHFEHSTSHFLHFQFRGTFDLDQSLSAVEQWKKRCNEQPDVKFVHIWDCQQMSGFDMKARNAWLDQLRSKKDATERIILVSENIFIRGAGRLMSKFTKHAMTVYKTYGEMSDKEL